MVDHLFLLAVGALGWGLSLATYRLIARRNGWPLGAVQAAADEFEASTWPTVASVFCERAIPGVDAACSVMMKNLIKKKGVASIEELREAALEADVKMIACQMTMDLFEYKLEDMIEGPTLGGDATYMEKALKSDVNLFI